MSGLQYVVCDNCGTVSALPSAVADAVCPRCQSSHLEEVPSGRGASAYFSRGLGNGR